MMKIRGWRPYCGCPRPMRYKKITADFLASRHLQKVRDFPSMDVKTLENTVKRKLKYNVERSQLYITLARAKEIITGDLLKQYEKLGSYCEIIRTSNPGSKTVMKVSGDSRSLRLYIRYATQKIGFIAACRPLAGIEECHLKGQFDVQLLAAFGWDANDDMFPLYFAIVEAENKDACHWFFLKKISRLWYRCGKRLGVGFGSRLVCCLFMNLVFVYFEIWFNIHICV